MSDVTFPNPDDLTPGYKWTNPATDVEYTWNGDRWIIVDTSEGIDLQSVLTNGNVADKDIYLTNIASSSDIIDISPDKAKIIVASDNNKVPKFELQHYAADDNSQVKLELDEDGTRFDIECDEKVDNIHFRFEEDDKFIINKKGDAVFTGKVTVQPGEEKNEVVTFKQLKLLETQIEEIAPSLERGQWEYTPNFPPGPGQYTMVKETLDEDVQEQLCAEKLAECQLANQNDPAAAGQCTREYDACMDNINGTKTITTKYWYESSRIYFSDLDEDSNIHRWTDIKPGQYMEVFNVDGSGGMVSEITKKNYKGDLAHSIIKGRGEAHDFAIVKIYELTDANPADFVNRAGDTMAGKLILKQPSSSVDMLSLMNKNDADFFNLGSDNDTLAKMTLANNKEFKIGTSAGQIFKIYADSTCSLGRLKDVTHETSADAAVNRNYVDSRRLWQWTGDQSSSPGEGMFSFSSSGAGYLYFHPWPKVGTKLRCNGNKYFGKGGEIEDEKWYGYAQFSLWSWDGTYWSPAMSGHVSSSGVRTGKDNEPWRFSSNKNSILTLEGLSKDKLYNICISGSILS